MICQKSKFCRMNSRVLVPSPAQIWRDSISPKQLFPWKAVAWRSGSSWVTRCVSTWEAKGFPQIPHYHWPRLIKSRGRRCPCVQHGAREHRLGLCCKSKIPGSLFAKGIGNISANQVLPRLMPLPQVATARAVELVVPKVMNSLLFSPICFSGI